ncbi:Predicted arabinose efflux permease, MFS family [Parasphingorhabdus marina DSM 22363]|uniref:Predicted arabinose efflux permease, MFS family n=1 Tax=Parasphingorhabdus marina DSM 22363 TaxID=1123272 RepID=A0A1N6CRF1_9SPHN|nr:Predicted arabinose efflux permease, MFS family [Parasphingorhabdus marina DSM 22363]
MSQTDLSTRTAPRRISELKLFLFSAACAASVAHGYYIHPLIAPVGAEFGVSGTWLGLVPAFNQIALALGILLLLPLGDRVNNRKLLTYFAAGQLIALLAMALAADFRIFVIASSLLGFATIAPYLVPAYVTRRVKPERVGHVTGILTAGITAGLLASRGGAGVLGHYFGWRAAYWVGAALALAVLVIVPLIMEKDEKLRDDDAPRESYGALIASLWPIIRTMPDVLLAGILQALSFGFFLALWLGIGLHLTSAQMGYGVDVVGYLALLAASNILVAPWSGRLADRIGAEKVRVLFAVIQWIGAILLFVAGTSIWILIVPIILSNFGGASMDVANRTILFGRAPEIRTRLMTVYIVTMFLGGGLSSWLGTAAYAWGGWNAIAGMSLIFATLILGLALWGQHRHNT